MHFSTILTALAITVAVSAAPNADPNYTYQPPVIPSITITPPAPPFPTTTKATPPQSQPSGVKTCPTTQEPACCYQIPKGMGQKCQATHAIPYVGYFCNPPEVLACCDKSGDKYGIIADGTVCNPF